LHSQIDRHHDRPGKTSLSRLKVAVNNYVQFELMGHD